MPEEQNDDGDEEKERKQQIRAGCSFLALAQRKTELIAKGSLHPLTHLVFGTPLLLRILEMEELTGRQIYDVVAKHLQNVVPASALKFLESKSNPDQSPPIEEGEGERTKYEIRQRLQKTMTDMEEVAAGPVPRYGFRLRLASRDGRRCAICPWYECCIGCNIPDDNASTVVMNGDSIVIDWHFAVDVATNGFGMRGVNQGNELTSGQQSGAARNVRPPVVSIKNHSSCGIGKKQGHSRTVTLEDCLDAFAEEEKIPEVRFARRGMKRVGFTVRYLTICPIVDVTVGILFEMQRFCAGADETHESLAPPPSRDYPAEALPIYTAHAS